MVLLWILMWLVLPNKTLPSSVDHCDVLDSSSSHDMSPWLQSLQCHNDYATHVDCTWKAQTKTTLQVWLRENGSKKNSSELCVPYKAENATEDGVDHCRYETPLFSMRLEHSVFFVEDHTTSFCPSSQHASQDLVQLLRARPPRNLSVSEESDGGCLVKWSSPYPSSSSLNKNLTYQLSFRIQDEDSWTTETVANTSVKLEKRRLLLGRRYEARVRTKASLGQLSQWSPVVVWKIGKADFGQFPSLDCVLDGEKEVSCSWEVSREVAYLLTYQLTCRHHQTAKFERCCMNPAVTSDGRGAKVRYICYMTDQDPEHLQLKLLAKHNAKTFIAHKHILPSPPEMVNVRWESDKWVVEWSPPAKAPNKLYYQVQYYRTKDKGSSVQLNITDGYTSVNLVVTSLIPLQAYEVKVRSLVAPGFGSSFEGIPSEWSETAKWTSNEATWSISKLIYVFIGISAAVVFLTLYLTIPLCQKKVVLWVESVPSPGKSKILSEMKTSPSPTLAQSEKTSICSIQQLDSISTCSSDALLCPPKGTEETYAEENKTCCDCDNLPSPADNVNCLDTSSLNFSGPYILCQRSGCMSVNAQQKGVNETSPDAAATLFPAPSHRAHSRSTEGLTSHSSSGPICHNNPEQDQHHLNFTLRLIQSENQSDLGEPSLKNQSFGYTTGPFPSWPEDGIKSGYCQLPSAFIPALK